MLIDTFDLYLHLVLKVRCFTPVSQVQIVLVFLIHVWFVSIKMSSLFKTVAESQKIIIINLRFNCLAFLQCCDDLQCLKAVKIHIVSRWEIVPLLSPFSLYFASIFLIILVYYKYFFDDHHQSFISVACIIAVCSICCRQPLPTQQNIFRLSGARDKVTGLGLEQIVWTAHSFSW